MPSIYGLTEDEISILKVSDPARCERLLSSKSPLENFIDTLLTCAPFAGKVIPNYLHSKTYKSHHVRLGQQWSSVRLNEFNRLIFGFKTAVISICLNPSKEAHKAIYQNTNKINQLLGICDELLQGVDLRSRVEPMEPTSPQAAQKRAKAQQKKSKEIESMKFDMDKLQTKLKVLKLQNQEAMENIAVLEQEKNELRKREGAQKATEMLKVIENYRKKHHELKQHFKSLYEKHYALRVEYASERTKYARLHDDILAKTIEKQASRSMPVEQNEEARKTIQALRDERNKIISTRLNNCQRTGRYQPTSQEEMQRLNEIILQLEKFEHASDNVESALLSSLSKDLEILVAEKNALEIQVKEFREKEELSKKKLNKYKKALEALTAQSQYSQQLWQSKGDQFLKLEAEKNSFERLLLQLKDDLVIKESEIEALKSSQASFKAEIGQQLERKEQELLKFKAAQVEMQEKLERLIAENTHLQQRLDADHSSTEKLAHEKVVLEARVAELIKEGQQLLASHGKLKDYAEEIRHLKASHQTAMSSVLQTAESEKANAELLKSANATLVRKLEDKRMLLKTRQSEIESIRAAMSAQTSENHALTLALEQYKHQYQEASASIQKLEQTLREKKASWQRLNKKYTLLKETNAQNVTEAQRNAEKMSVLKIEITALESRLEILAGQHEQALIQKDALYETMQREWQKKFDAEKEKAIYFEKLHAESLRMQEYERRLEKHSSGNTPPPPPYFGEDHQGLKQQLEDLLRQNADLTIQLKQLHQAKERVQPICSGGASIDDNSNALVQKAQASSDQQSHALSVFQGAATHNSATQTALSALSSTVVDMTGTLSDTLDLSEISPGPNSVQNNGSNDLELTAQLENAVRTNQQLQHELKQVRDELAILKQNSEVEELKATIELQKESLATLSSTLKSAEAEKEKALRKVVEKNQDIEGLDEDVDRLLEEKQKILDFNEELLQRCKILEEAHEKALLDLELLKAQQSPKRSNGTQNFSNGMLHAYSISNAVTEQSRIISVSMKGSPVRCS